MIFYLEGSNVGFTFYFLRDGARDWWEEVGHSLGAMVMASMTWDDFMIMFGVDFALAIEVMHLARDFQDLRQTT